MLRDLEHLKERIKIVEINILTQHKPSVGVKRNEREAEARQRRGRGEAEARQRRKPAEFRAMYVEMREPKLAGEARSFIGSAQQQPRARGDCRHAQAAKGGHLAPLTPLTGAAPARGCIGARVNNADYAAH